MTKDEIHAKIKDCEAQLATVRADIINGAQEGRSPQLTTRREELMAEIAALRAMLDEV